MKIDNTIFIVETEESESAHETAEQKIKKLIEAGIDGLVNEERRRLNNQKATFEVDNSQGNRQKKEKIVDKKFK